MLVEKKESRLQERRLSIDEVAQAYKDGKFQEMFVSELRLSSHRWVSSAIRGRKMIINNVDRRYRAEAL